MKISSIAITAASILIPLLVTNTTHAVAGIDTSSREASRNALIQFSNQATASNGWTGSLSTCDAGLISSGHKNTTLSMINLFRSHAGLHPVSINTALSSEAQQAALIMHANSQTSKTPPTSWRCYSSAGATAAQNSNLIYYGNGFSPMGVFAVLLDLDGATTQDSSILAERRSLLRPNLSQVGIGATSHASAITTENSYDASYTDNPAYFSWPTKGYFPITVQPNSRIWSFHATDTSTDFSSASVDVTVDGGRETIYTTTPLTTTQGTSGISWLMPEKIEPSSKRDVPVTVTISGMKNGGATLPDYTYTTTLYDEDHVTADARQVHRFYSPAVKRHLYTVDEYEKNSIIANFPESVWKYEGVAFQSPRSQSCSGNNPVYRFYSPLLTSHLYTMDENEKQTIIRNFSADVWKYEGIAYCANQSMQSGQTAVYRFYSEHLKTHLYTMDENEKNSIIANFPPELWKYEGVAYYAHENIDY